MKTTIKGNYICCNTLLLDNFMIRTIFTLNIILGIKYLTLQQMIMQFWGAKRVKLEFFGKNDY